MSIDTKFKLHATIEVQGEGRKEEAYTYISEDGTKGLQFRADSKRAFMYVIMNRHNVDKTEASRLIEAFVFAGMRQHKYAGGWDEAIQNLSILSI
jgi:hypothetical protein